LAASSAHKLLLDEVERLAISRICHLEISYQINKLTDQPRKAFETRQNLAEIKMENLNHNLEYIPDIAGRPIRTNVSNDDRNPQGPSTWRKVAPNEDCPCGSGKKYKNCHGAI